MLQVRIPRTVVAAGLLLGLAAASESSPLPWPVQNVSSVAPTGDAITLNAGVSATYEGRYFINNEAVQITAVAVMNSSVLEANLSGTGADTTVLLRGLKPGVAAVRLSALYKDYSQQNPDGTWGKWVTYVMSYGVLVRTGVDDGPGLPADYTPLGSRAVMGTTEIEKWYQAGEGLDARRTDVIDMYMQGGPASWVYQNSNWDSQWYPGKYLYQFIRGCKRQGRIPCVVFYCIPPDGVGDSALAAIKSVNESAGIVSSDTNRFGGDPSNPWQAGLVPQPNYMRTYYHRTVRVMREVIQRTTSDGWPCLVVIEPDFIGYMSASLGDPVNPNTTTVTVGSDTYTFKVSRAFEEGPSESGTTSGGLSFSFSTDPLLDLSEQAQFPNTLKGFVTSIPHILRKPFVLDGATVQLGPQVKIGWKLNLWASRNNGGYSGKVNKPNGTPFGANKGIIRWTDAAGQGTEPNSFGDIVQWLGEEAAGIADYYISTGITNETNYLFIDRYGVDAASKGYVLEPAASTWFWNHDHWNNYLAFVESVQRQVKLPIILWQLPMGHINTTVTKKPDGVNGYTALTNAANSGSFEDSSATFWFGDTFSPGCATRAQYFSTNQWAEIDASRAADVSTSGSQITWAPALSRLQAMGVAGLLSGPGVGMDASTFACAQIVADTKDDYWWINQAQRYYREVEDNFWTCVSEDYDGDGKTDPATYQQATGRWYCKLSGSGYALVTVTLGGDGYAACVGDYDGDGRADPVVYQEATGVWYGRLSASRYALVSAALGGGEGYTACIGDYDGDGKADPAVYHEATGIWYGRLSVSRYALASVMLGGEGYTACVGDYDGDGRADPAVYQEATGTWLIKTPHNGYATSTLQGFGGAGYVSVPVVFENDMITDMVIYEESTGNWYFKIPNYGCATTALEGFGGPECLPEAADFDGDGIADPSIFDKATATWYIKLSSMGYVTVPLASGYVP